MRIDRRRVRSAAEKVYIRVVSAVTGRNGIAHFHVQLISATGVVKGRHLCTIIIVFVFNIISVNVAAVVVFVFIAIFHVDMLILKEVPHPAKNDRRQARPARKEYGEIALRRTFLEMGDGYCV